MYDCCFLFFFFFKQKTAYEMRISDWSSDVCSSDLVGVESLRPVQQIREPSQRCHGGERHQHPSEFHLTQPPDAPVPWQNASRHTQLADPLSNAGVPFGAGV